MMSTISHEVNRLDIEVAGAFDDFRARYEALVPRIDPAAIPGFVERQTPWDEVVAATEAAAPHGFLIYWSLDMRLMALAGDQGSCVTYLMGNHTIAERMYRHDQAAMLYVPLRTVICAAVDGPTRFLIDQPSTALSSLGIREIAEVGRELDQKLAALLAALDAPVPAVLREAA
jgi:hypothetical protein